MPVSSNFEVSARNDASRQPAHPAFKSEDIPNSPARVDAANFQGRGGREDGGRRRRPTRGGFDDLREEHLRQGILYEDKSFLPVNASIYFSRQHSQRSIQWVRPGVSQDQYIDFLC